MSFRSRVSWNSIVSFFSLTGIQIVKFVSSIVFVNVAGAFAVGIYFAFMSVYRLLNRATTLGMGQAIVKRVSERERPETDEITDTVATAFLLRAMPLVVITAALVVLHGRVDSYIGIDHASLLVASSLWLTALYSTLRSTLIGQRQVDVASGFDLLRDAGTAAIQVSLLLVGYAQWGLIVGFTIGLLVSGLLLFVYVRIPFYTASLDYERARSLFSFGGFSYLDDLVGGEHRWLDVVILGFFVSADSIGVYGIAYALAQFGLVFSAALGRNVLPEVSHLSSTDSTDTSEMLLYRALAYSTLFSFPILMGVFIIADRLLLDIYSISTGGMSLVILTAGAVVYGAYQQLHQLIYALDRPKYAFTLSALSTVINALIAVILVPFIGILGTAISTSLSMTTSFAAGLYLIHNHSDFSLRLPLRPWGLQAACAVVMGVVVFAVRSQLVLQTRFYSALLILVGASVYLSLIVSMDSFLRIQLRQLLSRVAS